MFKNLLSALVVAGVVAMPLALSPAPAQAKTEKQLRDEQKGKAAKEKSAAKSAAKKAASKKPRSDGTGAGLKRYTGQRTVASSPGEALRKTSVPPCDCATSWHR